VGEADQGYAHVTRSLLDRHLGGAVAPRGLSEQLGRRTARLARKRGAADERFQAATLAAVVEGAVGVDDHVPHLAGRGVRAAMQMLRTLSRPRCLSISAAAHSTIACAVASSGVLVLTLANRRPSERASATRTWVPPRSIPASIARLG